MSAIPFVTLDDPHYGTAVQVAPLVRRVIAENPSKFTYLGTGTYIVGEGDVAVIDPGPLLDSHRDALSGFGYEVEQTIRNEPVIDHNFRMSETLDRPHREQARVARTRANQENTRSVFASWLVLRIVMVRANRHEGSHVDRGQARRREGAERLPI